MTLAQPAAHPDVVISKHDLQASDGRRELLPLGAVMADTSAGDVLAPPASGVNRPRYLLAHLTHRLELQRP
jgi:hypothetical protein